MPNEVTHEKEQGKMVTLERKPLEVTEINSELRELAERAKSELGYDGLMRQWARPLAKALVELDIQPFAPEAVAAYKSQKLNEVRASLDALRASHKAKVRHNRATLCLLGLRAKQEITAEEYRSDVVGTRYEWATAQLTDYHGPVPEFVVSKALEIKSRVPQAEFGIDYLRYHFDPFLTARLGEEYYHVEVWNEPNFDENRLSPSAFMAAQNQMLTNQMLTGLLGGSVGVRY